MDDAVVDGGVQASPVVARELERELSAFWAPLLEWLDARLDRRLVHTCVRGIVALLEWRNRAHGLLLSELGAYVLDPAHAPMPPCPRRHQAAVHSAALAALVGQRRVGLAVAAG